MRFLFDMRYPGFLRYFDSVVEELTERGHAVDVAWQRATYQAEGLAALEGKENVRVHVVPRRGKGFWTLVARRIEDWIYFARYLDPRFASAGYLRRRAAERVPWPFRRLRTLPGPIVRRLLDGLLALDQALLMPDERIQRFLADLRPDAVVVSPLVTHRSSQAVLVANARLRGIPTAVAIASWDNLTCKSVLTLQPDRMIVWNETQRQEAWDYHRFPVDRTIVTGAQCFDRWFDRVPSRDLGAFCEHVGLPSDRPFLLFVGSTESISSPYTEVRFVREWLRRLRADPVLCRAPVLIRPHPYNSAHWADEDVSDVPDVVVFPRYGANPVDEDNRADYFDSLYHAAAVIGVNTSAMIEAAIVGRPVLTVTDQGFHDSQLETMHFHYLLPENGGFVRVASSLDAHLPQLRDAASGRWATDDDTARFVRDFVRPHGLHRPATPIVADAFEALVDIEPDGAERVRRSALVQGALWMVAVLELPHWGRLKLRGRARRRIKERARSETTHRTPTETPTAQRSPDQNRTSHGAGRSDPRSTPATRTPAS